MPLSEKQRGVRKGISGGAPSRAVGFTLTFCPSMLMLAIALYRVTRDYVR